MAQILSNLLTNAAKYTDAAGQIRLTANAEASKIVIRVADSGIGISGDALPGIFAMFAQVHSSTDRSEGGLGIGLALTKGLVELHGGKIQARSAGLGRGSEFTIVLPRRAATEVRAHDSDAADTSRPSPSRRVLIADDNRDAAETLAALLRMDGHEVTLIHDGLGAVFAYESLRPDVALLDIGMPGLNGYEVARKIREGSRGSAAKLIAVTGWGQESDKTRALAAGFDYHLTKPIDLQRLSELVQSGSLTGSTDLPAD